MKRIKLTLLFLLVDGSSYDHWPYCVGTSRIGNQIHILTVYTESNSLAPIGSELFMYLTTDNTDRTFRYYRGMHRSVSIIAKDIVNNVFIAFPTM